MFVCLFVLKTENHKLLFGYHKTQVILITILYTITVA